MNQGILIGAVFVWPLLLLAGCLFAGGRKIMPRLLWLAPLPGLALALLGNWGASVVVFRIVFQLDASAVLLLAAAAALWTIAGFAVPSFLRGQTEGGSFAVCWLLTLIGSLGVFLTTDLIGFLIFYALVSLPAYGMVIFEGTPDARRAGKVYMAFALLGENLLLLAFVQMGLDIPASSPSVLVPVLLGFGMKMALLPLHFWMPLAYTAAPIPAAAVLSGAAVKAGVIGMLRFLPLDTPMPSWGETLTLLGFGGAFYGVVVGLTQTNPKTVLAYSSISQMGFLAAVLGLGLSAGDAGVIPLAAFYAAHHVLAKGAMFLAVGAAGARRGLVTAPAVLIGLGLAGLPLTGGALAKLAVKDPLGYGIAALLASLSAAGTALLMMHFVFRLAEIRKSSPAAPAGFLASWLVGAVFCLVFPWTVFPLAGLSTAEILAPASLWKTLWPVALGGILAVALRPVLPRLPRLPAGDIAALGGRIARAGSGMSRVLESADRFLRLWPVACCSVLLVVLLLVWTVLS